MTDKPNSNLLEPNSNLLEPTRTRLEPKRCELEETESYEAARVGWNAELETFIVHVHECSECGLECEQVNGSYERCPHCGAVNVLDDDYRKAIPGDELEMIRMAEKYQLADDDGVERSDDGVDSREKLEAHVLERVKEGFITYTELIGWLDRQKRITIREHQEGCKYKAKADELQERVDSLTAELDKLAKQREILQGALDIAVQNETKLESERDTLNTRCNALETEQADLHETINELESELDNWRKLTDGIELPDYPMTEFMPKDKDRRIAELEAENDALKERISENGATEDEIRNSDVWNVAYEIYRAGGYVDDGSSEPNPPTNGIYKLLYRQTEIVERECLASNNWALQERYKALNRVAELEAENKKLKGRLENQAATIARLHDEQDRYAIQLVKDTKDIEKLTAERDELKSEIAKHEHDCGLLFDEKHKLEAENDKLREKVARLRKRVVVLECDLTYSTGDIYRHYDKAKKRIAELEAERGELIAERDRLRRFVDGGAYDCMTCEAKAELAERADSLEAELERKQHVCDVQRESFLKLEAENAELRKANAPYQTGVGSSREVGA